MSFYNTLQKQTMTAKPSVATVERKISRVSTNKTETISIDDITAEDLPLEFVKQYLRVDHNFDDLEIQVHMKSAKSYVRTYIKQPDDEPLDDGLIMPILALTAYFYENKSPQIKSTEKLDTLFGSVLQLHMRDVLGEY